MVTSPAGARASTRPSTPHERDIVLDALVPGAAEAVVAVTTGTVSAVAVTAAATAAMTLRRVVDRAVISVGPFSRGGRTACRTVCHCGPRGAEQGEALLVDVPCTGEGEVAADEQARGGGHDIHAEKPCHANTEAAAALARPDRYATVAGNLRVKEIHVAPGGKGDGDDGARTQRFWPPLTSSCSRSNATGGT